MALNRWQRLYRRLIGRFPRVASLWRRLVWWAREPGGPAGMEFVEPFPRWFGLTDEEEQWAKSLIGRYEKERR